MGDKFWYANLLKDVLHGRVNDQGRGSSAWGEQVRTAFAVCFVGLVLRENYVWCLVIFVVFMGFGVAEVGDAFKSSLAGGNTIHRSGEMILMRKERWGFYYM